MDKVKATHFVEKILLNDDAQRGWIEDVDPDFFKALKVFVRCYAAEKSKTDTFRIGVILGGVYERSKWTGLTP